MVNQTQQTLTWHSIMINPLGWVTCKKISVHLVNDRAIQFWGKALCPRSAVFVESDAMEAVAAGLVGPAGCVQF